MICFSFSKGVNGSVVLYGNGRLCHLPSVQKTIVFLWLANANESTWEMFNVSTFLVLL